MPLQIPSAVCLNLADPDSCIQRRPKHSTERKRSLLQTCENQKAGTKKRKTRRTWASQRALFDRLPLAIWKTEISQGRTRLLNHHACMWKAFEDYREVLLIHRFGENLELGHIFFRQDRQAERVWQEVIHAIDTVIIIGQNVWAVNVFSTAQWIPTCFTDIKACGGQANPIQIYKAENGWLVSCGETSTILIYPVEDIVIHKRHVFVTARVCKMLETNETPLYL